MTGYPPPGHRPARRDSAARWRRNRLAACDSGAFEAAAIAAATLSIADVAVTEGHAGTTNAVFTVTLTNPNAFTITVNFATADDTATSPGDYQAQAGTLTFTPGGPMTQTITVPINGDTTLGPGERFAVNLSGATNALIGKSQGSGTIRNDDATGFSITDVIQTEGNAGTTNVVFTVTLSGATALPASVTFATANGTATGGAACASGVDYQAAGGTLQFPVGTTTQTVTVPVCGDTAVEPDETFFVNLSGATNATIADNQGQGTITNDDATAQADLPDHERPARRASWTVQPRSTRSRSPTTGRRRPRA